MYLCVVRQLTAVELCEVKHNQHIHLHATDICCPGNFHLVMDDPQSRLESIFLNCVLLGNAGFGRNHCEIISWFYRVTEGERLPWK